MIQEKFYLDTCIWLNLFKKEGNPEKGVPYWKIAQDFVQSVGENNKSIIVSTAVLKEISFKLAEKFELVRDFFRKNEFIKSVNVIDDDYLLARRLESESLYNLSFFDCLHIAICKRINAILITRDRLLINFAKKYVSAKKPEEYMI